MENFLKRSMEFNIFKVLRLEDFEIRHSNFLAWLLDPNENHELKDKFLQSFLTKAGYPECNTKNVEIKTEVTTYFPEKEEYNGKRIDILIESEDFICIVENKFGSKEHSNQCQAYYDFIKNTKDKTQKNIFLDLNDKEYKEKKEDFEEYNYKFLKYRSILDILRELQNEIKNETQNPITNIIEQYITILEEKYGLYNGNEVPELTGVIKFACEIMLKFITNEYDDFCINNDKKGIAKYDRLYHFAPFFPSECRKCDNPPLTKDRKECIFSYEICYENNAFMFKILLYDNDDGKSDKIKQLLDENFSEHYTYKEKGKSEMKNIWKKILLDKNDCVKLLPILLSKNNEKAKEIIFEHLKQILDDFYKLTTILRKSDRVF